MSPARSSALVEPEPAAWSRSDTEYALHTAFRLPIAWLAGERHWARLVLGMPRATRNLTARTLKPRLASTLGRSPGDPELGMLVAACVAARTVRQLQFLRCHRPGGWSPSIRLQGREHLDAALSAGRGVILWVTPTAYASLITKMTLHLEDLAPHHLSRWYHGASRSRWGVRLLNPIQRRAEDLYLAERVSIGEHQSPLRALRQLRRLLGENQIVSITVGKESDEATSVPFLLGSMTLAPGPIKLAAATGAPLLPVATFRDPAGGFTTTIEPPLPVSTDAARQIAPVLRTLAERLERQALCRPAQFFWPGGLAFALGDRQGARVGARSPTEAGTIPPREFDMTI